MNQSDLKIVIVGRNGQLAWEANQQFQGLGEIICVGRPEVDLLNIEDVRAEIRRIKPSVLVNAAAYTAVDQAESEPETAMKINSEVARRWPRKQSAWARYSSHIPLTMFLMEKKLLPTMRPIPLRL